MVWLRVSISPRFVDEKKDAACQSRVAGDDETALAGCNMFALLQAEAADGADGSHKLAIMSRHEGLGAIFDHGNLPAASQFHDFGHFTRISEKMGDDDGLRPLAEALPDALSRDVVGSWVDISENRNGCLIQNGSQGSHIGNAG